jgi:hypothetical protein
LPTGIGKDVQAPQTIPMSEVGPGIGAAAQLGGDRKMVARVDKLFPHESRQRQFIVLVRVPQYLHLTDTRRAADIREFSSRRLLFAEAGATGPP